MRNLVHSLLFGFCLTAGVSAVMAQSYVDVPVNTEKAFSTVQGVTGLATAFGSPEEYYAVLRIAPLTPGVRYEATLTYDAGTDIGYSYSVVDGSPFGQDWASFVGIGTGTGTRELPGKQEKVLFTVDPQSTSNTLYLVLRTNKPFNCRYGVSDRLTGVNPNSQDRWGYYYVSDYDADDRVPPILLKRGAAAAVTAQPPQPQGNWIEIPVNTDKTVTTVQGTKDLASAFGSAEDYTVVLRIAPLRPGVRYEATLTYDAGTDIGYAYSVVDGSPFGGDWSSFIGIGTGTGTRELKDKQEKILFTVDPKSTSSAIYLPLRSNKPFTFRFGVSDKLSGVTPNSQDRWGYYYVSDYDADDRVPPILLQR